MCYVFRKTMVHLKQYLVVIAMLLMVITPRIHAPWNFHLPYSNKQITGNIK